jgi:glutamate formiminotransferase / 5-formyltetrahydrofolate cyclo-ligase
MMMKIVQCVPNISEGNDIEKIKRIIAPLEHQVGFKLISAEPDKDYNRTVITLIGNPEDMMVPLLHFFEHAKNEIDMRYHKGEHARMGAVDVCPFIPISGVTIEECVVYAEQLASSVWERLNIPVFLYAKAAKQPSRVSLPDIRKGEFEGMSEKLKDPQWLPDFGNARIHHTAGVCAIGARIPLIAFNIDIPSMDEKIANAIAKAIRQSSGGFQHIQAGPVTLLERSHTQVTMNILDFKKNPIYRVYETVKMEALRYGLTIESSEIVGLLPKEALTDSLKYYLQVHKKTLSKDATLEEITALSRSYIGLRDFDSTKIIESYL